MATIQDIREQRAAAYAKAESLYALGENATAEQNTELDTLLAQVSDFDARIKAAEDDAAKSAQAQAERQARLDALKPKPSRKADSDVPDVRGVRERVKDDPSGGFRSYGEFLQQVRRAGIPGIQTQDDRLSVLYAAATGMQQGDGASGGYLVPPSYSTTIWEGLNEDTTASVMAATDSYTVQGESLTMLANSETSRADGSRWGGAQAYWIAEAAQMTGSRPKFRQVKLEPHQMAVMVYVTDKLLANSPVALEQYVSRVAQSEINFTAENAIFNGTGSGQPKGIMNGTAGTTSCRIEVAKETGQAAATVVKANIDKMWARLHPRARANAIWYINVDVEPSLQNLSVDVGTGGVPAYLPPGGLSAAPYGTLKGRPVVPVEYCQTLGTVGDIILADMSYYAMGVRGSVQSAMSIHLRFDYNESVFRFIYECDGQPWLASAITPKNGSNTLSPFVALATRS